MAGPTRSPSPALGPADVARLQAVLGRRGAAAALDASTLDGFVAGVVVQPMPPPRGRWLTVVLGDGPPLPPVALLVVERREAELRAAVAGRRWFDPWVFVGADDAGFVEPQDAVLPWSAGFALALESFPELLERGGVGLDEALALVYRHVGIDHLDDADGLREAIAALAPIDDLDDAVEDLVRATLLLADVADGLRPTPRRRR